MRHSALLVAAVVVVGAGATAVVASAAAPAEVVGGSDGTAQAAQEAGGGNETANGTAPGARLAGVVGVQGAEVEGEVAERSFGQQLAASTSNAAKASVLAAQTGDLAERVAELRGRKRALQDARDDGNLSAGRYRAEMAQVGAELSTANRLLNRASSAAIELPTSSLRNAGVSAADIERVWQAAGNVSGPNVAEIAREISGLLVNRSVGPPENLTAVLPGNENPGPPGNDTQDPLQNETIDLPGNDTQDPLQNETIDLPGNDTQDSLQNETIDPPGNDTQDPLQNETIDLPGNDTQGPLQNETLDRQVGPTQAR